MYDRTAIMKAAWVRYRRALGRIARFDRPAFGFCLKTEWTSARLRADRIREAKEAFTIDETVSECAVVTGPLSEMEARIDALKYLPFRYSLAAAEAAIRAEYRTA